ncbi:MAG TPA: GAF domain-containing protein [Bryobacteraceae bacterium]
MKPELYREICDSLHHLLGEENDFIANAANTSALLFQSLPEVNWAGFYIARGSDLVLGPFQGKPACVRLPLGKGVCGAAAVEHRSVIVPDVSHFPGHIVCDPDARSEIAVPLLSWGRLIGVLDLDSATLNRFDEDDREGLESVAAILLASHSTAGLPDLDEQARGEEANSLS